MYECPNCAANLKYHIRKQMLYCESCETTVDPYDFQKESDAEESREYEVTIFTCPQCGGEIISDDTTAATFCSYCGSSTILDSRISKEKRPAYIIPFSKTEANCRTAYKKMLKQAVFAPDALKDEEHIKKFRGIYMPYWVYSFEKKGPVTFKGSRSRRRGDYRYVKHYDVTCDIDAEYKGIAFDASSTFSDSLSKAIGPFDIKKGKTFTPSFLSGFYADTNDVRNYLYKSDAEEIVTEVQCKKIEKNRRFAKYNVGEPGHMYSLKRALCPDVTSIDLALFPVWFLAYRKDDRVAYAVVNGQTGKVAADLPVDYRKYIMASLLLAVPIFILLNLFFTLKPNWLLLLAAVLALICTIIANVQLSRILLRESGEADKGLQHKKAHSPEKAKLTLSELREEQEKEQQESEKDIVSKFLQEKLGIVALKKEKKDAKPFLNTRMKTVLLSMAFIFIMPYLLMGMMHLMMRFGNLDWIMDVFMFLMLLFIFLPCGAILSVGYKSKKRKSPKTAGQWKKKLPHLIKPLASIGIAMLVLLINPVEDLIYYLSAIFCMGMVVWVVFDIIKWHNVLSTRKLPQLNRRGGDENA